MKLRLLLTEKCNRRCKGCCNKEWDLKALPVCNIFSGYKEVILTGGEPMLYPSLLSLTINRIRQQTNVPIYLYTACCLEPHILMGVLDSIEGMTLTLHTKKDVEPFAAFNRLLFMCETAGKSLRLNVFKGVPLNGLDLSKWKVRKNIVWRKDCPLPEGEIFMRLG